MTYDGKDLTPIFYSEISSSYLLFDIFDKHRDVTIDFIKEYYDLDAENVLVFREKSYPGKGSIDLFITFMVNDQRCALLIEAKVHDYSSVKEDQISTYYRAVSDGQNYDELYFIYLTQFNKKTAFGDSAKPKSLVEASNGRKEIGNNFLHLTWTDLHAFLKKHQSGLSNEQQLMVDLHRSWIVEKERTDLAMNIVETGERSLEDYLGDVSQALAVLKPLGKEVLKNKALKLQINLNGLNEIERDAMLKAIKDLANSESVSRKKEFLTHDPTLEAAVVFLSEMAAENEWSLLRFYAGLFHFAHETRYLRLNGLSDFSIKIEVVDRGEISLCRLRRNKHIEFSLRR